MMKKENLSKIILIFSTQRSGSTMVTSDFSQTEILGKPSEYFTEKILPGSKFKNCQLSVVEIKEEIEYILQKARTSNGIISIKIMSDYIIEIARAIAKIEGLILPELSSQEEKSYLQKLFIDFFNKLDQDGEFIAFRVYRKNKVKQAVSRFVAAKTGLYHVWQNDQGQLMHHYDRPAEQATPFALDMDKDFDSSKIYALIDSIYQEERELDILFENFHVSPINLIYEKLVKDTSYLESVVNQISSIEPINNLNKVPRKTVKTSSPINIELINRIHQIGDYKSKIEHILSEQHDVIKHLSSFPNNVGVNESCFRNRELIDISLDPPRLKPNDNDYLLLEGVIVCRKVISQISVYSPVVGKNYLAEINLCSDYYASIYWNLANSKNSRFRCVIPLAPEILNNSEYSYLELNYQVEGFAPRKLAQIDISHFIARVKATV